MTKRATITLATIKRALKAVEQTGIKAAVECCPDGTVRIVPEKKQVDYSGKIEL